MKREEITQRERELLPVDRLARLNRLQLAMGQIVEGVLTGMHKSPHRGTSVEFAEHKVYTPGDDIRHIDWRAYGRTDRYMVKHFEAETNVQALMMVDRSGSMNYRSGELSKYDAAAQLAAALSYLLLKQHDSVGTVLFGGAPEPEVAPPHGGLNHVQAVLTTLASQSPAGETALVPALKLTTEHLARRGFIALFSDLFADEEQVLALLRRLRHRKHRVVVFHILDRDELTFPFEDPARFVDMEIDDSLTASPKQLRDAYLQQIDAFIGRHRTALRAADIDYLVCDTSRPLTPVLLDFLKIVEG